MYPQGACSADPVAAVLEEGPALTPGVESISMSVPGSLALTGGPPLTRLFLSAMEMFTHGVTYSKRGPYDFVLSASTALCLKQLDGTEVGNCNGPSRKDTGGANGICGRKDKSSTFGVQKMLSLTPQTGGIPSEHE